MDFTDIQAAPSTTSLLSDVWTYIYEVADNLVSERAYNSCGGVVLCDGGRKQAAALGIGVQWGRRADKSKFIYIGNESTSCPKMTLRYEKSIVQNLSLFLG